jgi:hypothetical protein
MDSVARRTAAKTFDNAAHGKIGRSVVLQMVVDSAGRHPVLRALIKFGMKTCRLDFFAVFMRHLTDEFLEKAGYPDFSLDREVKILGKTHHISNRVIVSDIIRSVVERKTERANMQDIPGNALRLLLLAQEPLSDKQFCGLIQKELSRRHAFRHSRYFWDLLESEYTRGKALEIIRAGFEAEGRCFQTGVYLFACSCGVCDSDRG